MLCMCVCVLCVQSVALRRASPPPPPVARRVRTVVVAAPSSYAIIIPWQYYMHTTAQTPVPVECDDAVGSLCVCVPRCVCLCWNRQGIVKRVCVWCAGRVCGHAHEPGATCIQKYDSRVRERADDRRFFFALPHQSKRSRLTKTLKHSPTSARFHSNRALLVLRTN